MSFNFKGTQPATGLSFFNPGVYELHPTGAVYGTHNTGTPYAAITFANADGTLKLTEKFSITDNAIDRLQYFHSAFFGKLCDKDFPSPESVAEYFNKCVTAKKITKRVIVGGNISNGKVFAQLPYTNFVDADSKYTLGEFDKNSEEYKEFVRESTKPANKATGQPQGLLNGGTNSSHPNPKPTTAPVDAAVGEEDKLPWE